MGNLEGREFPLPYTGVKRMYPLSRAQCKGWGGVTRYPAFYQVAHLNVIVEDQRIHLGSDYNNHPAPPECIIQKDI